MPLHGNTAMLALALVLFAGPAPARQAGGNVRAAIEAANSQFVVAFAKGDVAKIASMYTADAQVFPPNSDVVRGRAAIQKFWQGVVDAGIKSATLTTLEVEARGDWAHEVGTYTMSVEGGKQADRGKYLVIWKREQGQWQLHRDIWNTNVPAKT